MPIECWNKLSIFQGMIQTTCEGSPRDIKNVMMVSSKAIWLRRSRLARLSDAVCI